MHVGYRHPQLPTPGTSLTLYGVSAQLGCGLSVKQIRGHRYLYFAGYEPRSWGVRRLWTYVGPVGRPATRAKASQLLLVHHVKVRREVEQRIERLREIYGQTR